MTRATLPVMSELNNRTRVSPYPLRSNRTQRQQEVPKVADPSDWEDVKCMICMEAPHNAVLLQCASPNCRPYMCDTNTFHSNCYKQFRKTNGSLSNKMNCPYCRGEVFEATKVPRQGRKIMNAKPRSCPVVDCEFSGTYCQLEKHRKSEHPNISVPTVDQGTEWDWVPMTREEEYNRLMTAAIDNIHESLQNLGEINNMANTLFPRLNFPSGISLSENWFL